MAGDTDSKGKMNRRDAILRVSAVFGVALVGQAAMLAGCTRRGADQGAIQPDRDGSAASHEVTLLDEIAETILPETRTPGARAAGVGAFMALMVADTYTPAEQSIFRAGLDDIDSRCRDTHGSSFLDVAAADRLALLEVLDAEQHAHMRQRSPDAPVHYFRMMKELALVGYFTSEIGYTQAMRYIETPGRFDPCVPYEPGEKAWARHA